MRYAGEGILLGSGRLLFPLDITLGFLYNAAALRHVFSGRCNSLHRGASSIII
jgi:hypothetical protein